MVHDHNSKILERISLLQRVFMFASRPSLDSTRYCVKQVVRLSHVCRAWDETLFGFCPDGGDNNNKDDDDDDDDVGGGGGINDAPQQLSTHPVGYCDVIAQRMFESSPSAVSTVRTTFRTTFFRVLKRAANVRIVMFLTRGIMLAMVSPSASGGKTYMSTCYEDTENILRPAAAAAAVHDDNNDIDINETFRHVGVFGGGPGGSSSSSTTEEKETETGRMKVFNWLLGGTLQLPVPLTVTANNAHGYKRRMYGIHGETFLHVAARNPSAGHRILRFFTDFFRVVDDHHRLPQQQSSSASSSSSSATNIARLASVFLDKQKKRSVLEAAIDGAGAKNNSKSRGGGGGGRCCVRTVRFIKRALDDARSALWRSENVAGVLHRMRRQEGPATQLEWLSLLLLGVPLAVAPQESSVSSSPSGAVADMFSLVTLGSEPPLLVQACQSGDAEVVDFFLNEASGNDHRGTSAAMMAAVGMLFSEAAKDRTGDCAFNVAVRNNDVPLIKFLLGKYGSAIRQHCFSPDLSCGSQNHNHGGDDDDGDGGGGGNNNHLSSSLANDAEIIIDVRVPGAARKNYTPLMICCSDDNESEKILRDHASKSHNNTQQTTPPNEEKLFGIHYIRYNDEQEAIRLRCIRLERERRARLEMAKLLLDELGPLCAFPTPHPSRSTRRPRRGDSALHVACRTKNIEMIELILAKCNIVTKTTSSSSSSPPTKNNNTPFFDKIINAPNSYCNTPLHVAAWVDSTAVARVLISNGCNTNAVASAHPGRARLSFTPVQVALWKDNMNMFKELLRHGCEFDFINSNFGAAGLKSSPSFRKIDRIFFDAVTQNDLEAIRLFVFNTKNFHSSGALTAKSGSARYTPLHAACLVTSSSVVDGSAALSSQGRQKNLEMIKLLVSEGVKLEKRTAAAASSSTDGSGGEEQQHKVIDAKADGLLTPLHRVVTMLKNLQGFSRKLVVVMVEHIFYASRLLIEEGGADRNLKNHASLTAYDMAKQAFETTDCLMADGEGQEHIPRDLKENMLALLKA